jgi:hypothetical protein
MVRSNPAGAVVYVDNREIGTTPCAVNFTYYGTREIRLVKDGFETLKDRVHIRPPWYELPPLDFVSENLVPWEINDQRHISYQLEPQLVVPNEELLRRGDDLRRAAGSAPGPITPTSMAAPLPAPGAAPGPVFPPTNAAPPQ